MKSRPHLPAACGALVLVWAGVLLLWSGGAKAQAQAADRIWAGVVLASQAEHPKAPPPELARVAEKLERVFGYNQLEVLGIASRDLDEQEHWLVPTEHFWMSEQCHRLSPTSYLLQVTLYHDKRSLVETQARLSLESPLIIRGPMHARGQIIVVMQIAR